MKELRSNILTFQRLTGLSDHRVGILLADNGMLVSRVREKGRHFPETLQKIERNLRKQIEKRDLDVSEFVGFSEGSK